MEYFEKRFCTRISGGCYELNRSDSIRSRNTHFNGKIKIDATISTLDEKVRDDYFGIIAGIFTSTRSLKEPIKKHLETADEALLKAAEYIELLGISKPIVPARDEDSKLIFKTVMRDLQHPIVEPE